MTAPVEVREIAAVEGFPDPGAPSGASLVGLLFHGEPAGCGWWRVEGAAAEGGLVVLRTHRGLGLGKMLLGAVETRARAAGASVLRIPAGDDVAAWMLRRAGYEPEGEAWVKRDIHK